MGRTTKQRIPSGKRWYWVAKGRQHGVFQGWDTVAPLVSCYPGAIYAFATSKEEAQATYNSYVTPASATTAQPKDKSTYSIPSAQPLGRRSGELPTDAHLTSKQPRLTRKQRLDELREAKKKPKIS